MEPARLVTNWLEKALSDGELELSKSGKRDKGFLRRVKHVLGLLNDLGFPSSKITQGVAPGGAHLIRLNKPDVTFVVTGSADAQEFFDRELASRLEVEGTVVTTNVYSFYCTRAGVVIDGGNFQLSAGGRGNASPENIADFLLTVLGKQKRRASPTASAPRDVSSRLKNILNSVKAKSNEETLKKDFVFPLCRIAGWHIDPDDQNDPSTSVDAETFQAHRGRLDLLLNDRGIPRIVIECKKPGITLVKDGHVTDDGRKAMEQTHRYATGVRFWRQRCLPNIMSLVTNGRQAIWFDSSIIAFQDAFKSARCIELTPANIQQVFQAIELTRVRETDLSYICRTATIYDKRLAIESSSTHLLSREVVKWITEIRDCSKIPKHEALAMTLQILFLTVARDHGILGSEEIKKELENSNWDAIFAKCYKRFNSNVFEMNRPKGLKTTVLDKLYEESKTLPFSLEAIPVEYVGEIYESLLHHLHSDEPHLSKTSYYTPQYLVREIVEKLNPSARDACIDPTCGSSAFLCYVFEYVTKGMNFEQAKKFLSTSIYGVDRDPLAVQVSRFALLVDLARKSGGDWKEGEHILPKLTDRVVEEDFFRFETKQRFSIALGNPPWGSIDKEVTDPEIKTGLKNFESYRDKTDVSIYVVEKSFGMLSAGGRIAFLVQRSTIDGVQHKEFRNWWENRVDEVWDYGSDELFAPRNSALTAVVFGKAALSVAKTKIVNRSSSSQINSNTPLEGANFEDWFHCMQGGQAAKNEVFELYADQHPNDKSVRAVVGPDVIRPGAITAERKSLFLAPGTPDADIPDRIRKWLKETTLTATKRGSKGKKVSASCEQWLRSRAEVVRKSERLSKLGKRNLSTLSWLWLNDSDKYRFDDGQMRIVFPYYLNGDRLTAGLDKRGEMVPLTSTTVLIPKDGVTEHQIYFALGWLNSKVFARTEARRDTVKMAAKGGRALYRDYVAELKIPTIPKDAFNDVVRIAKSGGMTGLSEQQLLELDAIFERYVNAKSEASPAKVSRKRT